MMTEKQAATLQPTERVYRENDGVRGTVVHVELDGHVTIAWDKYESLMMARSYLAPWALGHIHRVKATSRPSKAS